MMPLPSPALRRATDAIKRLWAMGGFAKASAKDNAVQAINALEVDDLIAIAKSWGVDLVKKPKRKRLGRPE